MPDEGTTSATATGSAASTASPSDRLLRANSSRYGTVRASSKPTLQQRNSSIYGYHTFPSAPPRNQGPLRRASSREGMKRNGSATSGTGSQANRSISRDSSHHETPLPKKQLLVLAMIALCIEEKSVGWSVGLIASAFALSQLATNFFWGWLSDRIGRKPVILMGTLLTAVAFLTFGFCSQLWHAILVQALMGLVNGNAGVVSTTLGEITDRSNQGRAFTWLPVVYGIGAITGPIVGGLLVMKNDPFNPGHEAKFPYLLPNVFSAALLMVDFIIAAIFLEESLENAADLPKLSKRFGSLWAWVWQFSTSYRPTYTRRKKNDDTEQVRRRLISHNSDARLHDVEEDDDEAEGTAFFPESEPINYHQIFTTDTILILLTWLIFNLANVSYSSLYPIYVSAEPRRLGPESIGFQLAFSGIVCILFQLGLFGRLRERMGNRVTYRISLLMFAISFFLTPWIGFKENPRSAKRAPSGQQILLQAELCGVLVIKTIASVSGMSSALLLVTNSAPSHRVLGTLNGIAQTISAAGRAAGPFAAGGLFSIGTQISYGEVMCFYVFGGISLLGSIAALWIRSEDLEGDDWDADDDSDDETVVESHDLPRRGR